MGALALGNDDGEAFWPYDKNQPETGCDEHANGAAQPSFICPLIVRSAIFQAASKCNRYSAGDNKSAPAALDREQPAAVVRPHVHQRRIAHHFGIEFDQLSGDRGVKRRFRPSNSRWPRSPARSASSDAGVDGPVQKVYILQQPHGVSRKAEPPMPRVAKGPHVVLGVAAIGRKTGLVAAHHEHQLGARCIPHPAMLRLKERRQQSIDAQQSRRGSARISSPASVSVAFGLILLPGFAPVFANVDPELAAEIARVEPAGLELQDHLANQQLMRGRPHGAAQRQLAAINRSDIAGPIGLVLIVHARGVAEGGHAGANMSAPCQRLSR